MRVAVERGAVIGPDDVMPVQVGTDPALRPVPASQASTVVGQRAGTAMAAGTPVTREQPSDADSIVVFLAIRHKPGIDLTRISERDVVSATGVLGQYVRGGALNTGDESYPR